MRLSLRRLPASSRPDKPAVDLPRRAALLLFGSLYRLNAYLVAYLPAGTYSYFPSVPEILVTVGIVALEVLLYLVFIKVFPVLAAPAARSARA
ncbi:MAG: hypothetical protein HC774_04480 [Sphingomonadales bacterium]|nr:hypothetical protein [Sphingomonadales bacterium]